MIFAEILLHLTINGQSRKICSSANLAELLRELEIATPNCAVALNQQVVPRTQLDQTEIHDGDQVEIVHAVGGGL